MSIAPRRPRPALLAILLSLGIAGWSAMPWPPLAGQHRPPWTVVAVALAASPAPAAGIGGDTRSAGEGPGFVGAPFLAILGVLALGVATALFTLLYVRLTGGRSDPARSTGPPERDEPDAAADAR